MGGRVVRGCVVLSFLLVVVPPALAAPGTPGVPQPPIEVYLEDFENVPNPPQPGPPPVPGQPQLLADHTGASGVTYTAHLNWLDPVQCNGIVISFQSTDNPNGYCPNDSAGNWNDELRGLALDTGIVAGDPFPELNHAVSAFTHPLDPSEPDAVPGANLVELETEAPFSLPTPNRYLAFAIDVAVRNCNQNAPVYDFFLLDDASPPNATPAFTQPINPCTDPRSEPASGFEGRRGRFATDGSVFYSGGAVGLRVVNRTGTSAGNDAGWDNIRILDATPQLDKEFAAAEAGVGEPVRLTFTITNTDELAAKEDWSFTDQLEDGLAVADPAGASTDCAGGTITAVGGTITVAGDLATGDEFCTATVDVTSAAPGSFVNGPNQVASEGVNPPAEAAVRFQGSPMLKLKKRASTRTVRPGEVVSFRITLRNRGNLAAQKVRVCDRLPRALDAIRAPGARNSGRKVCWSIGAVAPGERVRLRVTTLVSTSASRGVKRNVAIARAGNAPRQRARDSVRVAPAPDTCPSGRFAPRC